jgi:hypothetical protein
MKGYTVRAFESSGSRAGRQRTGGENGGGCEGNFRPRLGLLSILAEDCEKA